MNDSLSELISAYTRAAADLFPRVANHLEVDLPVSNIEWACLGVPLVGQTNDGIKYRKHGYGVEMDDGTRRVDLDLGNEGQIDGFDAWRLFRFAENNRMSTKFRSHGDVEVALKKAVKSGEVVQFTDDLYYLIP
jgi:hypothetical protein